MGLFDFLSRRKKDSPPGQQPAGDAPVEQPGNLDALWINDSLVSSTSDAMLADASGSVWNDLQEAIRTKQFDRASALCESHEDTIAAQFAHWCVLPEAIRTDSTELDQYVQSLVAVAEAFEKAGNPNLLQALKGDDRSNPMMAWDFDLRTSQRLLKAGDLEAAIDLLQSRLQKQAANLGTGKEIFEPRTYGMLGIAYHLAGETDLAIKVTGKALAISQQLNDQPGIAVYEGNLQQMRDAQVQHGAAEAPPQDTAT